MTRQELLCSRIANITDQLLLDKIEATIAEPEIVKLIKQISEDRDNSFSADDQDVIKTAIFEAPGDLEKKITFLETCLNKGYIDMGQLLKDATTKVVSLERATPGLTSDLTYQAMFKKLAGRGGGGFNLGSGAAVGPGEGFFILVCKGVTKGAVGDLAYNGQDVELKANAARWHSARAQYKSISSSFKTAYTYLVDKGINVSESTFKTTVDFRNNSFITKEKIQKMGVGTGIFAKAWALAFADVLPKGADVSFLEKDDWIGDSKKFRAAYAAAIASAYQTADDWAYILQYDYTKKTVTACTSGADVHAAIIKGRLKSSSTPDGNFLGGSDSRSMSPNFDVGNL